MLVPTAARFVAVSFLLFTAWTPSAAGAVERLGTVRDWTLYADAHPNGRPYCYAGAERGAGDRITLLRGDPGLVVVLSRAAWPADTAQVSVEVALDDAPAVARRGTLQDRSLVIVWGDDASRAALTRASALRLRDDALASRWRLDGAGAVITALDRCFAARLDELARTQRAWRAIFDDDNAGGSTPGEAGTDLATDFARWFDRAGGGEVEAAVATADRDVFALRTRAGAGGLRLLAGDTHAAVHAGGAAWLRATCAAEGESVERERRDVGGTLVARLALACDGTPRFEALVLSYADAPGGFLVALPAASGRGAAFTAALRDDLLADRGALPALAATGRPF
jgi:hypothetical protein